MTTQTSVVVSWRFVQSRESSMLRSTCILALAILAGPVYATGVVVCVDPTMSEEVFLKAQSEVARLQGLGYTATSVPGEKKTETFVGVGMQLAMDTKGVIAVGALKGSSADATGMFGKIAYRVMAVDGVLTAGKSSRDVSAMIRGAAGTGVVVTFKLESRDRTFDRHLERRRITYTIETDCIRADPPRK